MKMQYHYRLLNILLFVGSISQFVNSKTNSQDVSALNVMFKSLNSPSKLSGWQSDGGDPCDDSWEGISCKGSAVTEIKLSDYGLNGQLGYQLASLKSVTTFDMSKNNLNGNIPYQLPPNLVYLYLSGNSFSGNVPYSISEMKNLKELDLSHNKLNGQLSEMFSKLSDLTTLDLSSNQLTGNLPQSFANLSSLTNLYLQDNRFTGSINPVRDLPLNELNVKNNKFTGWIPNELKGINSLETEGNSWSTGKAPPPPPGVHHSHGAAAKHNEHGVSIMQGLIIAAACVGALVVIAILIGIFSRRKTSAATHYFDDESKGGEPFSSFRKDSKSGDYAAVDIKSLQKAPSKGLIASLSSRLSFRDNEFANRLQEKRSTSIRTVPYALADLQNATSNFAGNRLLGEGSIGRVYKAKYGDGKVLAVKKIDPSLLHGSPPEEVSGVVASISKLHHPNIADLVGYCSEKENVMLVYNHYRNGSLHEFLHMNDDFSKPLTWNTRIRIGLGTARAIEYLHEVCSPPLLHKNIKSSNILLDLDLNPHLSDHGLAKFHQRTSQNLGVGYNAPECSKPSAYTLKSDVYSFGVVMLELLTGRKPLDSKRPKTEECLVQWATPQLHDAAALERMVDPALRGLYPPKSLSRFADIISRCVQVEPELRPRMSEVVQSLERLVQQANMEMKEDLSASSCRTEDSDTYYRF